MFDSLSDRLTSVFRSFRGVTTLNEENVKAGLREVRLALLEADVNYKVVGSFIETVREKCLGQEVLKGVSPAQQVVSIVNEQLIELLGGATTALNLQGQAQRTVRAAIAPGLFVSAGIVIHSIMHKGETFAVEQSGVLALDGERDLVLHKKDTACVRLALRGVQVVDVPKTLEAARTKGLFARPIGQAL